ncbi:hypothetical protein F5Y19DRAFT_451994 [Xylariaceae sp. FL1651]|nr:hypothetical protein F5Y19DRAFT_451994 [Xylariaceae sp. FL1651]
MACNSLSAAFGQQVSYPGQLGYNQSQSSYTSIQEATLAPECVIYPTTAQDVASIVSTIVSSGCNFAVRGHGHAAAAGFANIDGGVTIDMTSLTSLSLSDDGSVVSVGAGARWIDVYAYLDPFNVQVAGGRNGQVGVGGLLVGGGISHFSARAGWSCDNVVNFEVALANGQLINANKSHNADLWRALKGGSNNFGIVTRYDIATFAQDDLSVTLITNDISQRSAVFDAFTNIANSSDFDPYTALAVEMYFNSSSGLWVISNEAVYTKPVPNPPVFDELVAIPSLSKTSRITSLPTYANSSIIPQTYWLYASATFSPSTPFLLETFDVFNNTFFPIQAAGGVIWFCHFETVPTVMTAYAQETGGNVLGVGPQNGNGVVMLISAFWTDSTMVGIIEEAGKTALEKIRSSAKSKGLSWDFQYLNYAGPYQDVIKSYGPENVKLMKQVSKKYDPKQVFQKRVPGGFKLPA